MKTSHHQFEMLVTYMEQHGDLSKPTSNARGRITTIRQWEELVELLNSDGSGDTKTTEKWKKVWSDFKNNTKKKAARLHRAASGTGGGPAVFAKLTDLEQRVLNLIGELGSTGLALQEAGFSQNVNINHTRPLEANLDEPTPSLMESPRLIESIEPWNQPGPSNRVHIAPSPHIHAVGIVEGIELQPGSSSQAHDATPSHVHDNLELIVEGDAVLNHPSPVQPAQSGHTPRRTQSVGSPRRRIRGSPRRLARRSPRRALRANDEASQQFLRCDREWRDLKLQQHRDNMDMRREQNRIREMELQTQREWQCVASRALDLLNKLVSKYCGDNA